MKHKVLLVYTNVRLRNQKPRPPVGLLYLAAALREKYETVILDMRTEPDFEMVLNRHLTDCIFVGISTIIGQQLVFSLEVSKLIKRLAPDMPVVFGGTFPSMAPEVVLREPTIDIVSIGDGEDTLCHLADALVAGTAIADIPNLAYKQNGEIVIHQGVNARKLDTPVVPAWDLVNVSDYREANVLTSKGCSAGCSFCYNRLFNQNCLRLRPAENVWKEISMLHNECGVTHIAFIDDNFFGNQAHAKEIMHLFCDSDYHMTWETTCRADDLAGFDSEMLSLIRDSGCKELFVGFESASDEVLRQNRKHITTNLFEICMQRAREYGFLIRALFVIGLVGETKKQLFQTLKTVDYLRRNYSDCVKIPVFGIYTPYPHMPPDLRQIAGAYTEPTTMEEWSNYHHDRANHQWLTQTERDYLENIIWIYRYYSKRSKFTQTKKDKLLYYDAVIRWKLRFFSAAPEWRLVRKQEIQKYHDSLAEIRDRYQSVVLKSDG